MKRYPEYKDSGVEWLGEVPGHWEVAPLKRSFQIVGGSTPKSEQEAYWEGEIVWVTPSDLSKLSSISISDSQRKITSEGLASCGTTLVPSGSIVLSTRAPIGSLAIAETELCTNQGCKSLVPFADTQSRFYGYLLSISTGELNIRGKGTTFLELSGDELGAFKVGVPPSVEQQTIAAFLDRETGKIDALIAEQRRLVELLAEKRQAVISHAVTKGLNPKVPMKDSGIEWLGEVPEHWEVGPVKRFFTSYNPRRVPLSGEERSGRSGEFPYYGASGIIDYIDEFIFDEDLVLVSEDGANLVNRVTPIAFVANGKYWVNNHAHILKPLDQHCIFWAERLESIDLAPFITGSAQPKLTSEALNALIISVPTTAAERLAIQSHIVAETAKFDTLTAEANRAIALLQERRSALISAAVTGKIDVRGVGA